MNKTLPRWLTTFLVAFFSTAIISCATMEGAGEDIESAGEEIQEAADDN